MSLLGHVQVRWYRFRLAAHTYFLRRLARSDTAWRALDGAGIGGFGTNLLRFDFPPRLGQPPAWGHGRPSHSALVAYIAAHADTIDTHSRAALAHVPDLGDLPVQASDDCPLAWLNQFQTPLDLAVAYGILRTRPITRYLEIGSGLSTHVANRARRAGSHFELTCIDPEPRVAIAAFVDHLHRNRMEDRIGEIVAQSGPNTVVFVDGSHFAFPGSDVTSFFLDVLPALRPGTLVHIHDIYLPDDYPPAHLPRLWNEQYLLAAWILGGGARLQPVVAGHWLATKIEREGLAGWVTDAPDTFVSAYAARPDSSCWWMEIT